MTKLLYKGAETFFRQIEPVMPAYRYQSFSYSALRTKAGFELLKAGVFLNPVPSVIPCTHFQSRTVRAGHYTLDELGLSARAFVDQILTGTIDTPAGPLLFRNKRDGSFGAVFDPFHPMGLQRQQRYAVLTITGGDRPLFRELAIDWDLKAHDEPFFNLGELLGRYDLGGLNPDRREQTVEVIAFGVAAIDFESRVDNTQAKVRLRVADGLLREKVSLGYRVVHAHECVERGTIPAFDWSSVETGQLAETEIEVPPFAVVDCTVRYDGIARHHWWIGDPSRAQNPRRAAYEAVDPGLKIFSDYITKSGKTSGDQHNFEVAVAWLAWMLGFSPAHLGSSKQLETADLVLTSPNGDFAVVECTTGLLKVEHKLARLIDRTEAVRSKVDASYSVIPVIVTSKSRRDVRGELADAQKLGVLVVTRENLSEATTRTILMPDADSMYAEAVKNIAEGIAKYNVQEELDLGGIET